MSENTQLAVRPKASQQLAAFIGMDAGVMLDVIRAQCFKGGTVSNEQLAAFVSIAAEMGVNPLLPGMLYAYPISGGGIVPMMGPDGVYKKLTEHPDVEGWETKVFPEDVNQPPTHAVTCIWRKGRERPITYTAILSEWKIQSNPNWNSRPRHMLGMRSLKQAARQIIHGVPFDEDERVIMGEIDINDRTREIPRAQISAAKEEAPSEAVTVNAEVVDTAPKKAEKKKAERTPVEETKPEPKAEPEPEKTDAPADKAPAPTGGSLKEALEKSGLRDPLNLCVKMANQFGLTRATMFDEIPADVQASILADWDTAIDAMIKISNATK